MIRYGIIGCGNIARFHFNALEKINAKVTWVADIKAEAAKPWAGRFGAKQTTDYSELIQAVDVDVVCILASGGIHKDAALKAIQAGKGIICEKTMMDNARDAFEVAMEAEKAGTVFFTSYMKRFFPAIPKIKELIDGMGTLFSANVRAWQCWGNFYSPDHGWDLDAVLKVYGGAIVKCAASHMLDMTMYLLGRPARVYAGINYYPGTRFDRKATMIFEYDDALTVSFEAAAHPLKKIGYERNSWDEFIEINGTNGRLKFSTVMWDHPENNGALLEYYDNVTETYTEYRYDSVNPFDTEIAWFNKCFEKGEKGSPNERDGYYVDQLIESIFESDKAKQTITIPWKEFG